MCDKCTEVAEMVLKIENFGGTGTFRLVEFTFPAGEPVMYTNSHENNTST